MSCLFCKIIKEEIPATRVYEDDNIIAFNDIRPQAPIHTLIIPRKHIETINDLTEGDEILVGKMVRVGQQLASELGEDAKGYRLVFNCNKAAGQEVFHIHLHLLAGRPMHWPPG